MSRPGYLNLALNDTLNSQLRQICRSIGVDPAGRGAFIKAVEYAVQHTIHGRQLMKRDTLVTITSHEYVEDNDRTWLVVRTDKTGEREFRQWGYNHRECDGLPVDIAAKCAIGTKLRLGDLHNVPVIRWEWLASIRPGVNVHVGEMSDGLTDICPPMVFWRMIDANASVPMPYDVEFVAREAAMSRNPIKAKVILEHSAFFERVYQFEVGGPSLNDCVEIE